jgi:cytosine/adenosine deaminase-related metal-dependent hydrolase
VRGLLAIARRRAARASLHLLEHDGERRAIEQGDGPAAEWMARRLPGFEEVVWPKRPVLDHAAALDALAPDVILVHLTIATPSELERIAKSGAPVVCCPRSNWAIEGKTPPLPAMLAAGIEPALGTDSLASSPSLDVLEEARVLATAFPEIAPDRLLRMLTWNGAQTLGRPDLGRIAQGACPGLVLFEGELGAVEPSAFVLAHRGTRRFIARRQVRPS